MHDFQTAPLQLSLLWRAITRRTNKDDVAPVASPAHGLVFHLHQPQQRRRVRMPLPFASLTAPADSGSIAGSASTGSSSTSQPPKFVRTISAKRAPSSGEATAAAKEEPQERVLISEVGHSSFVLMIVSCRAHNTYCGCAAYIASGSVWGLGRPGVGCSGASKQGPPVCTAFASPGA